MHIIPHKFVRIRHYGILSNRNKKQALRVAKKALGVPLKVEKEKPKKVQLNVNEYPHFCPCCQKVTVHLLIEVLPLIRGSPENNTTLKH